MRNTVCTAHPVSTNEIASSATLRYVDQLFTVCSHFCCLTMQIGYVHVVCQCITYSCLRLPMTSRLPSLLMLLPGAVNNLVTKVSYGGCVQCTESPIRPFTLDPQIGPLRRRSKLHLTKFPTLRPRGWQRMAYPCRSYPAFF